MNRRASGVHSRVLEPLGPTRASVGWLPPCGFSPFAPRRLYWRPVRGERGNGFRQSRILPLGGIRGFAVLLVFCVHQFGNAANYLGRSFNDPVREMDTSSLILLWLTNSNCGVYLLFVLSGFLIGRMMVAQTQTDLWHLHRAPVCADLSRVPAIIARRSAGYDLYHQARRVFVECAGTKPALPRRLVSDWRGTVIQFRNMVAVL